MNRQFLRTEKHNRVLSSALPVIGLALLLALNGCGMMSSTPVNNNNQGQTASFMFVVNNSGSVSAFSVSSSGSLASVPGSPFATGAGAAAEFMAFDSVHNLLFVSDFSTTDGTGSNLLSAFSVNTSTGVLTAVPGSPFATGNGPAGVAVAPNAGLVFVGNQNDNSVSIFNINAMTGSLTLSSTVTGVSNPFGLTANPAGTLLFVNNFNANTVSAFQISNGTLVPVNSPFPTSNPSGLTSPVGLATDGNLLFVSNHMDESVSAFQIGSNGALTSSTLPSPNPNTCGNSSCHNNPLRLTVDPMDKFVFATNVQAGTVTTFTINSNAISSTSTATVGTNPYGVAVDPTDSFLFVANRADNTISSFSINQSSGALTPLSGSPFSGNGLSQPKDMVIVKAM